MAMQSEPLKEGFLVTEVDGSPEDLPVKLRFPNGSLTRTLSGELSVDFVGGSLPTTYLKLDQTTPQTITATDVTITATDEIYYGDATDSFKIKKDTIQGILDLVPSPDLSAYVPYTGATGDVDLGTNDLTADSLITNKHIYLPDTDDLSGVYGVIYKAGVPFIHNYHKIYAVNGTTPLEGQNLFIGKDAGNFTLGATATTAEQASNNLGIGKEALKSLTTGYDNVGIGALSSSKITTGRGNIYIGGNAGAASTSLSFNVGIGQDSVKSAIAAGGNLTAVGYESLMGVNGGGSLSAFGTSAGRTIVSGSHGSFFGFQSGYYARGDASTFFGSESGRGGSATVSNGTYNTAVGYQALRGYTTGGSNTVIGANAGDNLSTGSYNVAVGRDTLAGATGVTRDTAIGSSALSRLTSGNYNTAVGNEAGGATTGAYNVDVGYRAGLYTLGTATWAASVNSVHIGASTESAAAGQTNEIVIGYNADGKGSNTCVLGADDIATTYLKGDIYLQADGDDLFLGTGQDASIGYDGTNLIINPKVVGTGYLQVSGQILATDKILFTQTDGNEYIDSLADGFLDYGATTAHRFLAPVKLTADNRSLILGESDDASISYNGTDLIISADDVGTGIVRYDSAYGEIYVADGSTAQTIGTGTTYVKLTSFTTDGEEDNCTADSANDKITITKAGKYLVNGSFNFSGDTSGAIWRIALFYDGAEVGKIHVIRKIGNAGDVGSASFTGILNSAASKDIDVRARHDGLGDETITMVYSNLNVSYIGE